MSLGQLFTPDEIRGLKMRNRIFSSSHQTLLARDWCPNEEMATYHEARSAGGAGLIAMEAAYTWGEGAFDANVIDATRDACIPGFRKSADAIHRHDCKVFGQISNGRRRSHRLRGRVGSSITRGNRMLCTLFLVLHVTTFTLLANPVWADCEAYRDLAGRVWVDGTCMETPLGERWWPHPLWGEGDQAGSTNWYTKPEVVARALSQVKLNRILKIGQEYSAEMPLFEQRSYSLRIPGGPTGDALGKNQVIWNDEFLAAEVGQVGTQLDGFGHIGVQIGKPGDKHEIRFYNGFTGAEILDAYGLKRLGTEKLHSIVARGVLIDIAAFRGVAAMEAGEVISLADVRGALKKQGMADFELKPGDAVLFRTGWERYWIRDNEKYNSGCPGIGMEVARWLADGKAGVSGADTWAVEVVPASDPDCQFCVHTFLLTRHGIVNHENLTLSALVEQGVYMFAYFFTPVPIRGATGSIGSPAVMW